MSFSHLCEMRLRLYVLKFIFDVHSPESYSSAHIVEGIVLSFQMGTFRNVGLFVPTGCRGPPQSIVLPNPKQIDWRNHGGIHTKESVRFRERNVPGTQLR